jgi:hypothetical protein
MIAGKSAEQIAESVSINEVWAELPASARRCFDARAARAARAAGQGLELVASHPISPAAAEAFSERLRTDLQHIERLFLGR